MKKVYVSLIADLLHAGHINILKEAAKLGELTVGLLTLEACGELNDIPYLEYDNRKEVLENLSMVKQVIAQTSASYKSNLEALKPDIVVHGDDWVNSSQSKYRNEVRLDRSFYYETMPNRIIEREIVMDSIDNNKGNYIERDFPLTVMV